VPVLQPIPIALDWNYHPTPIFSANGWTVPSVATTKVIGPRPQACERRPANASGAPGNEIFARAGAPATKSPSGAAGAARQRPAMFSQLINPTGNLFLTWIVTLVPRRAAPRDARCAAHVGMACNPDQLNRQLRARGLGLECRSTKACSLISMARRPVFGMSSGSHSAVMLFNTLVVTGIFD
jgi:hypothetical protein